MTWTRTLAVLLLAGCAAVERDEFRSRRLATLPEDARVVVPVVFSLDGRTAAWVEQRAGTCAAVCGGRRARPYGVVC